MIIASYGSKPSRSFVFGPKPYAQHPFDFELAPSTTISGVWRPPHKREHIKFPAKHLADAVNEFRCSLDPDPVPYKTFSSWSAQAYHASKSCIYSTVHGKAYVPKWHQRQQSRACWPDAAVHWAPCSFTLEGLCVEAIFSSLFQPQFRAHEPGRKIADAASGHCHNSHTWPFGQEEVQLREFVSTLHVKPLSGPGNLAADEPHERSESCTTPSPTARLLWHLQRALHQAACHASACARCLNIA